MVCITPLGGVLFLCLDIWIRVLFFVLEVLFPPPMRGFSYNINAGVVRAPHARLHRTQMVHTAFSSPFAGTDQHISTRSVHPAPSNISSPTSHDDAFTLLKMHTSPPAHTVYVGSDSTGLLRVNR